MELPIELWTLVALRLRTLERWALLGVSKNTKEAVLCSIESPDGSQVLNREQSHAFARVALLRQNLWLTGKAGSGKSHVTRALARTFAQEYGVKSVAICAPTGTAAMVASVGNIRGHTLHFAFNIRSRNRARGDPLVTVNDTSPSPDDIIASLYCNEQQEHIEGGDADDPETTGAPTCVLDKPTTSKLRVVKLLMLDEASMASSEMIDLMDAAMKKVRGNSLPFGGVVVMCIADFFQLAPILNDRDLQRSDGKKWAFEADAWNHLKPVQLTQVVRQSGRYVEVLNRMRVGQTTYEDVAWINRNSRKRERAELAILPSNKKCGDRNDERIRDINSPTVEIQASYGVVYTDTDQNGLPFTVHLGPHELPDTPVFPTKDPVKRRPNGEPAVLRLKVGCRVRCLRNIYVGTYGIDRVLQTSNGQLGTVTQIEGESAEDACVKVLWDALGEAPTHETNVFKAAWVRLQKFKAGPNNDKPVYAVSRQIPLALASAITIHSAQGGTFAQALDIDPRGREPVVVNGRRVLDHNGKEKWGPKPASVYVAMSRTTDIANVRLLTNVSTRDVVADPFVVEYYRRVFGDM